MKREIHLRELQLLDAVRRRFMHHQQTLKETELQRLDDEIERKVSGVTGHPTILSSAVGMAPPTFHIPAHFGREMQIYIVLVMARCRVNLPQNLIIPN